MSEKLYSVYISYYGFRAGEGSWFFTHVFARSKNEAEAKVLLLPEAQTIITRDKDMPIKIGPRVLAEITLSAKAKGEIPFELLGKYPEFIRKESNRWKINDLWDQARLKIHGMKLSEAKILVRFILQMEDLAVQKFLTEIESGKVDVYREVGVPSKELSKFQEWENG